MVAGIAVASLMAYNSTERELDQATDQFLETRAGELTDGRRQPPPDRNDGDQRRPDQQKLDADPDAISQFLDRNGTITASSGEELPVEPQDVAIAAGAPTVIRDVELTDGPYRMITEHDRDGGAVQVARSTSTTADVLSGLRLQLVAFGTLLAVVAALAGWLLMRRTTQPLEDLTAATERVATSRDLTPLRLDRGDEVGRLANSFDRMLGALALSREQQHRLVQDAAHELRTPLTSLRANIELLDRARNLPDDDLDALLGGLDAEVKELGQLFDELIQLATDTSRQDQPDVDVDLAAVVEHAVDRFMRRTGRQVSVHVEPTVVTGNPTLLERAVSNLLGNAGKFSDPGSPIEIRLVGRCITVTDHGPGIPEPDREHVFDRFYRSSAARSEPGSGLGLAIVRQIAEEHGGSTWAEAAPGGGAAVSFTVA